MPITVTADWSTLDAAQVSGLNNPSITPLDPALNGTVRFKLFKIRQAATANDVIRVATGIPRCVILPQSYVFRSGSTITSLTLDIGWQDYMKSDGTTQTGDIDGIADGLDIAAAGVDTTFAEVGSGLLIDAFNTWELLIKPIGANILAATVLDIGLYYVVGK